MERLKVARRAALVFAGSLATAVILPATALAGAPSNDGFGDARRVRLAEMPFMQTVDPTGASTEANEPLENDCGGLAEGTATVWYKVRLGQTRTLRASAWSTEETMVAVWRGTGLTSLTGVGCNDDVNEANEDRSRVAFRARADRWYYIQLVADDPTPAPVTFELRVVTPPAHDDFGDARTIGSLPFEHSFKNVNATVQDGEPTAFDDCVPVGATAWYRITPQASGTLRADTIESGAFDTFINVYRRTFAGLTSVGCSDDFRDAADHAHARAAFLVQAGETYYLQVGGYEGESGPITLRVRRVTSPFNDAFANAPLITAHAFDLDSSTANATVQSAEPLRFDHPGDCSDRLIGHTVWFRLEPGGDPPNINLKTLGSDFDTIIAVYTGGPSLGDLDLFACNDDVNDTSQSIVTFDPEPGTTYYVQVGGYYFDSGSLSFSVNVK